MERFKVYWIHLRSSLWFVPFLILLGATLMAFLLIEVDHGMRKQLVDYWPRLFASEPEGSQAMLAAIASSMITVAGVVFSITILALAQASTQYSPRVLRNFMSDRRNQVVLGVFVGVFTYCLVVLRSINRGEEYLFVPSLAVFCGFLLALVAIGFLIYFIHHIASSIQASTIIHEVTEETLSVMEKIYPMTLEQDEAPQAGGPEPVCEQAKTWEMIPAMSFGYVQSVADGKLFELACKHDIIIRMECGTGEFVFRDRPLAYVCGKPPGERLIGCINDCFSIDAHRTVEQDPAFGIQQLADIAVKALSPGVNDTTTASNAVDYLGQILCEAARRRLDPGTHIEASELRVISKGPTFQSLLRAAFSPIIENAVGNTTVISRLLTSITRVAEVTTVPQRRFALLELAQAVGELLPTIQNNFARKEAEGHYNRVLGLLNNHS